MSDDRKGASPVAAATGSPLADTGSPLADEAGWVENRPPVGWWPILDVRELLAFRELVWFLALRDVKARYKQAVFGVSWAVIQPIVGVVMLTVVFRGIADVPSDGLPYPVFALLGFTAWTYFSTSLTSATNSLVNNAMLVTKVYFPRVAAPAAALVPGGIDLTVGLVLLVGLMAYWGVVPTAALLVAPFAFVWLAATALGAGLVLSTLHVRYRDVRHAFGLVTQAWFFASPVAYPISQIDPVWRWVYALNPMSGVVETLRWSILGGPAPGAWLLVSLTVTATLVVVGLVYFHRSERRFADVI